MIKSNSSPVGLRKKDQLRVCLSEDVEAHNIRSGFERYYFIHQGLPEVNASDIDLGINLLGKKLKAPIIISSMTGGTEEAGAINRHLAEAAQRMGLAMGVGSQRAALENPSLAGTYQVRDVAPDILLFANLGAVQLNYGYSLKQCRQAVDMIGADALILHLNPLQEGLQAGGETNFSGLLAKIEKVCDELPCPVIIKEVGCGISPQIAEKLARSGVAAIDVAGAGGTLWSEVEALCVPTEKTRNIARAFSSWGIPTADSLKAVRQIVKDIIPCIGSGGVRTGIDAAKALALGAAAVGIAGPVLKMAAISAGAVVDYLTEIEEELRLTLFCLGISTVVQLRDTPLLIRRD